MEIDRSSFCDHRFYRFLQLNDHFNGFEIAKYRKDKNGRS